MTPDEFKLSLAGASPPGSISPALTALWWAGKDQWNKAHELVMGEDGDECAWVHAHLHRVEGDLDNARYWYRRARRKPAEGELATEWSSIVAALLGSRRS